MEDYSFISLIKERPDPSLSNNIDKCIFCNSEDVEHNGSSQTLVGGDNHHWHRYHCKDCDGKFTCEQKDHGDFTNYWITTEINDGVKVLKGIPSCFEDYIYTCSHCGGDVRREYKQPDGVSDCGGILSYDMKTGKGNFRIFFSCQKCGEKVETEDEYWSPNEKFYQETDEMHDGSLRLDWRIEERIGIVVINDYAIAKVQLKCEDKKENNEDIIN